MEALELFRIAIIIGILAGSPQVETTQATVQLPKENLPKLEALGNIINVKTFNTDKFPKPNLTLKANTFPADGKMVRLALEGDIPKEVVSVTTDWKVFAIKLVVKDNKIGGFEWIQEQVEVWPDGKLAILGAGIENTTWMANVSVTYLYKDAEPVVTSSQINSPIIIGTGNPFVTPIPVPVPVPPTPGPGPAPTPTVEKYGLISTVVGSAKSVNLKPEVAKVLAGTHSDFLKALEGGLIGADTMDDAGIRAVFASLKNYNLKGLKDANIVESDYAAFTGGTGMTNGKLDPAKQAFAGDILYTLTNKGEFKDKKNLIVAVKEIRDGLLTYAK
jgi:hypothetical protein